MPLYTRKMQIAGLWIGHVFGSCRAQKSHVRWEKDCKSHPPSAIFAKTKVMVLKTFSIFLQKYRQQSLKNIYVLTFQRKEVIDLKANIFIFEWKTFWSRRVHATLSFREEYTVLYFISKLMKTIFQVCSLCSFIPQNLP